MQNVMQALYLTRNARGLPASARRYTLHAAKKAMHLHKGDNIVMTAGNTNGASGNTNLIKVETI